MLDSLACNKANKLAAVGHQVCMRVKSGLAARHSGQRQAGTLVIDESQGCIGETYTGRCQPERLLRIRDLRDTEGLEIGRQVMRLRCQKHRCRSALERSRCHHAQGCLIRSSEHTGTTLSGPTVGLPRSLECPRLLNPGAQVVCHPLHTLRAAQT